MTALERTTEMGLTSAEQSELQRCEEMIDHLRQAFIDAGNALAAIRENRLYRSQFATFEEYCQARWGFSRVRAHQLIDAAKVSANLLTVVNTTLPENEAQVRPLTRLETAEAQQDAWQEAVERSNGKPTAKVVSEVVQERTSQPGEPERFKTGDIVIHQGNFQTYKVAWWIATRNEYNIIPMFSGGVERTVPASVLVRAPEEDQAAQLWAESVLGVALEEEPAPEPQASDKQTPATGLQPDFTYVMSDAEKRQCNRIGGQYGCTVRQIVDLHGRGSELWEATREGIVLATTNTLKNMPTYIEQAIAWKGEYEQEMSARGYHLVTHLNDGSIRFAAEYLPRTESGGFQTVDLSLIKIAAIRRRAPKHQRAIDAYYALLERDSTLVGAVDLDNPAYNLYTWLEEQGYQWDDRTWCEIEDEPALPEGWQLREVAGGKWEAHAQGFYGNTHTSEDAAIREAMTLQGLSERLQSHGFDATYTQTHGWQLHLHFTGHNANGELEEFLYLLEWDV